MPGADLLLNQVIKTWLGRRNHEDSDPAALWNMTHPFFTIGHSTRSVGEFVDLLKPQEINIVVDVRAIPRSRANPQYSATNLSQALSEFEIGYEYIAALGGLRGKKRDVPADVNAFWKNRSFHNYADYAMGDEFRSGLARLRETGHVATCAIMCAEAVWWRCHRRIIADYLLAASETVFHILGTNHIAPARLTPGIVLKTDGTLSYPGDPDSDAKNLQQNDN